MKKIIYYFMVATYMVPYSDRKAKIKANYGGDLYEEHSNEYGGGSENDGTYGSHSSAL